MFKKMLFVAFLLAGSAVTQAQTTIGFGDTITGEINSEFDQISYEFKGETGMVALFSLDAEGTDFNRPIITLRDAENREIESTGEEYSFREAILAVEITQNGLYDVIVSRLPNRPEDAGTFTMDVIAPIALIPGETLSGTAQNDAAPNYYYMQQVGPLQLDFTNLDTSLITGVTVYEIQGGELINIATAYGSGIRSNTMSLVGEPGQTYIVTVGEAPFSVNVGDLSGDYEITLRQNE